MSRSRYDHGMPLGMLTLLFATGLVAAVLSLGIPFSLDARTQDDAGAVPKAGSIETVEAPEESHLTNVHRIGDDLYSGSGPHDDRAFAWLASLGVRTIVSVDGTAPDVDAARRHGIRYVHLPIGYDQVDPQAILALARVAREIRGPIYFHCHHGKHRGPAAAAAYCRLSGRLDVAGASELMRVAGTDPKYRGLWESVERLEAPAPGTELPELVETSEVEPVAAAMSRLDDSFGRLQRELAIPAADDQAIERRTAIALLVVEGLVESQRTLADDAPASLRQAFDPAIAEARGLLQALDGADATRPLGPEERWRRLERQCADCHATHRG